MRRLRLILATVPPGVLARDAAGAAALLALGYLLFFAAGVMA